MFVYNYGNWGTYKPNSPSSAHSLTRLPQPNLGPWVPNRDWIKFKQRAFCAECVVFCSLRSPPPHSSAQNATPLLSLPLKKKYNWKLPVCCAPGQTKWRSNVTNGLPLWRCPSERYPFSFFFKDKQQLFFSFSFLFLPWAAQASPSLTSFMFVRLLHIWEDNPQEWRRYMWEGGTKLCCLERRAYVLTADWMTD